MLHAHHDLYQSINRRNHPEVEAPSKSFEEGLRGLKRSHRLLFIIDQRGCKSTNIAIADPVGIATDAVCWSFLPMGMNDPG